MPRELLHLMDALRPLASMYRHLGELREAPDAALGVVAGVVLYVKDVERAMEMYAKCATAFKGSPVGAWTDTLVIRTNGGNS
jgi:hypothetical protein